MPPQRTSRKPPDQVRESLQYPPLGAELVSWCRAVHLADTSLSLAHTELYASVDPSALEARCSLAGFDALSACEAHSTVGPEWLGEDCFSAVRSHAARVIRKPDAALQCKVQVWPNTATGTGPTQWCIERHDRTGLDCHRIEVRIQRRNALSVIEEHEVAVRGESAARLAREPHASRRDGEDGFANAEVEVEGVRVVGSKWTIYPLMCTDVVSPDDPMSLSSIPRRRERKPVW